MKQFFTTLRESIWSPKFYDVMGSRPTRSGIRYFLSLMLFISFIMIVVISIFVVPSVMFGLNFGLNLVTEKYPADLVINFKDGIASTTPSRVYELTLLPEIFSTSSIAYISGMGISNMLVVDTSSNFENISQFKNAKTFALLTKNSIVVMNDREKIEINSFKDVPNITLTKSSIENMLAKIISVSKYLIPIFIILGFFGLFILGSVMYMASSVISALLMWGLSALAKRKGSYREFFTTALYAVTLPVLLNLAALMLGRSGGIHGFTIILITVLVWAFNTKIWVKSSLPSTTVNEPPTTTM